MRIAFFVEGSEPESGPKPELLEIWTLICKSLGVLSPDLVFPINKKQLIAMDPGKPPMSGAAEALDDYLRRKYRSREFDAAVVLWDLHPQWNKNATMCRWTETIDLYKYLKDRALLPKEFQDWVQQRYTDLSQRSFPSQRATPVQLTKGAIVPICMEPEFENWLLHDERALKEALDLKGKRAKNWSKIKLPAQPQRRKVHLAEAILAAQAARSPITKKVHDDWERNQLGWTQFLVRSLASQSSKKWASHPLARRLKEVIPPQIENR